jgi:hypothetical protein
MADYAIVVSKCGQSGFIGLLLHRNDGKSQVHNSEQDQQTYFRFPHTRSFLINQLGE